MNQSEDGVFDDIEFEAGKLRTGNPGDDEKEWDLYFPQYDEEELNFIDTQLGRQIAGALDANKHIILTGPPGTGKSELAKIIAESEASEYEMVTATNAWSEFDTIGGLEPGDGNSDTLEFRPGIMLKRFQKTTTAEREFYNQFSELESLRDLQQELGEFINKSEVEDRSPENLEEFLKEAEIPVREPTSEWLLIDEINRADIDKAFGPLFSVLAGDSVTLSHDHHLTDQPIQVYAGESSEVVLPHEYYIPDSWRIIATMNDRDKTSLYEMSFAFMRRFARIEVGLPSPDDMDSVGYLDVWFPDDNDNGDITNQLDKLYGKLYEVRPIGPAILHDIAQYMVGYDGEESGMDDAFKMYVLPQLEGLRRDARDDLTDVFQDGDLFDDSEAVRKTTERFLNLNDGALKE